MIQSVIVAAVGIVLIGLAVVDIFWTITPNGSPPGLVANHVSDWCWRLGLRLHHRRPHHRLLAVYGVALFAAVPLVWVGLLWIGWTAVFAATEGAVVVSSSGAPAPIVDRVYFVATQIFTTGTGDVVPGPAWRVPAAICSMTGLGIVTLSVTYLVPAIKAATDRRRLARTISHLGTDVDEVMQSTWTGENWNLTEVAPNLADDVAHVAESHLTYPALHYLHTPVPEAALSVQVVKLCLAVERLLEEDLELRERRRLEQLVCATDDLARTLLSDGDDRLDADPESEDGSASRRDRLIELAREDGWSVVPATGNAVSAPGPHPRDRIAAGGSAREG